MPREEMKAGAGFGGHSLRPIFTGGEFEVDMLDVAGLGFIFDSEVGDGDFAVNDLQPMPVGDMHPFVVWVLGWVYFAQRTVEFFFQLIVQNYAADSASAAFNFRGHFLVEPVELRIVGQFLGLYKASIERLTFWLEMLVL